jgi:hypothetical protein
MNVSSLNRLEWRRGASTRQHAFNHQTNSEATNNHPEVLELTSRYTKMAYLLVFGPTALVCLDVAEKRRPLTGTLRLTFRA